MGYGAVTVTTAPSLLVSGKTSRKALSIVNISPTNVLYIGPDSSITTATALPIYEFQTRDISKFLSESYLGNIYGVVASTTSCTAEVRYWEITI